MPQPGDHIGPFEVGALLGAGGMGEVYRARDTRLQRDVALKLLPPSLSDDHDRLARFQREAQLLAALNDPHVAGIYGVEEQQGRAVLVLELVEGPTLADRLTEGPLPIGEAIAVAVQIARALEAAHEQGIVHRDLKPANIKLRHDGAVKVLDFGLAKATFESRDATVTVDAAASPTFLAYGTTAGVVLGTAAYMAPEQARGKAVDRRADIWAFGVVCFEMLTGQRPFGGDTVSETMAAIIKDPAPWTLLPRDVPPALESLLRRTLDKDPKHRLRDIGDARIVLEDLISGAAGTGAASAAVPAPARDRWRPWVVASILTAVALLAGAALFTRGGRAQATPELPAMRFTLPITGESLERTALPAISPDGRHIVFQQNGTLWIRSLDQLEPRQLAGTSGAHCPFWSPDSRQVAYLTANAAWRVGLDGNPPTRIASYRFRRGSRTPGGVWLADGTLVFAPAATGTGFISVAASGGEFVDYPPRDVATQSDFHRPSVLPDGRSILFVIDRVDGGPDTIGVLSNGARKDVLRSEGAVLDSPVYSPTGHLLYHRETTTPGVWAAPFSLSRLEVTGPPFLVVPQASFPSTAANGTLIYQENSVSGLTTLAWLDVATGVATAALNEQFPAITFPRLSPDGGRVAAVVHWPDEGQFLIVADLRRHTHVRIAPADAWTRAAWRDNRTLVYSRGDRKQETVWLKAADGSGSEIAIAEGLQPDVNAEHVVFWRMLEGGGDLFRLSLPPTGVAAGSTERFQKLPEHEWEPALSPDGKLLIYSRGDLGASEVVLRTYPQESGQWQVSSNGGSMAVWSPRGDAIYYRDVPGQVVRVGLRTLPAIVLDAPAFVQRPSSLLARLGFDVSPDGARLLMVQEVRSDDQASASLAVVQNWLAAFKR